MRTELFATLRERIVKVIGDSLPKEYIFDKSDFVTFEGKLLHVPPYIEMWFTEMCKAGFSIGKVEEFFESGEYKIKITEKEKDLSLADCLRVIQEQCDYSPESMGSFLERMLSKGWNLALPLHLQEDAVGEYLLTVIK